MSVAYMMSLAAQKKRRAGRKPRPVNPQSQRLWDVFTERERADLGLARLEHSFSANLVPLVVRARTLQRRLSAVAPGLVLRETAVPSALAALVPVLDLTPRFVADYRNFERGMKVREDILKGLETNGWLELNEAIAEPSVEVFHAVIAAVVAALYGVRLTSRAPSDYLEGEGWVHLPELAHGSDVAPPLFE